MLQIPPRDRLIVALDVPTTGDAEANQRRIRNAFKSERGPLDAKDAQLQAQLKGCD